MVYFNLNLTSNESKFKYSFPESFLNKIFEIGLVKIEGVLEFVDKKIEYDKNSNTINAQIHIIENSKGEFSEENIFLKCDLIDDSYFNENKTNLLYRFKFNEEIDEQPKHLIYHKVVKKPNEIVLKLVDADNRLIDFTNVNLWVELNLRF